MRKTLAGALAGVMLATSAITMAPAAEARHRHGGYYVQPYNNGYYDNGYYGGYHRRHHNNAAGAAILGFALGAIIAGAATSHNNGYTTTYRYDNNYNGYGYSHVERCARTYRSYDPGSDTFIGRDGNYYYCRL